jgi:aspartate/glutamate racemase
MNKYGKVMTRSSKIAPVVTDDDMRQAIDAIMAASVKREETNEALRVALDGLLLALNSQGKGLAAAISKARAVRR